MKQTPRHYAAALYTALEATKEKDHPGVLTRFVALLAQQGLLSWTGTVIKEFEKVYYQNQGMAVAKIVTARALDDKARQNIQRFILQKTGKKTAVFEEKIDAALLGGVKIIFDDQVLDASLDSTLNQLQQHLIL